MHGIWALVLMPLAAVFAWRCSTPGSKRMACLIAGLLCVGFAVWFGALVFDGAEFADSIYERVQHAIGAVASSINAPVVQAIAAALVFIKWPIAWQFNQKK